MSNSSHNAATRFGMGRVTLTVNDLAGVSEYYQSRIGLHVLGTDGETAQLGAGDVVLLELREDRSAPRRAPGDAGLFHTAFLLPRRADLAAWVRHAIDQRVQVAGASDHAVSEALYLQDPEGNGIEIYADRPEGEWRRTESGVAMASDPLDIGALLDAWDGRAWTGFPEGAQVGHVHLQVGDIPTAETFFTEVLGLDLTARYPGGSFFSANGYHHHIAANVWNSRHAPRRSFPQTGLAEMEILAGAERFAQIGMRLGVAPDGSLTTTDPWGTPIVVRPV